MTHSYLLRLIRTCHDSCIWHPTDISTRVEEAKGGLLVCETSLQFACLLSHGLDWGVLIPCAMTCACAPRLWLLHICYGSFIYFMSHYSASVPLLSLYSFIRAKLLIRRGLRFFVCMTHRMSEFFMSHMNESCPIWMSHVPYEWVMSHDSLICDMYRDSFIYGMPHSYVPSLSWLTHMFAERNVNFMNLSYVPWLMNMSHDPVICHDSFIRVPWLIHSCAERMCHNTCICAMTQWYASWLNHSCAEQVDTWVTEAPYARASLGYL